MAGDKPVKLGVCVFSYDGWEHAAVGNWVARTAYVLARTRPDIDLTPVYQTGYGAERVRNKVLKDARDVGLDYLLMLDADTIPDLHVGHDPDQVAFLPAAVDFARSQGVCLVGAPYCAGPAHPFEPPTAPAERVLVSRFTGRGDHPDAGRGVVLECFTRAEAAARTGFELVSSLPTGCLLIDTRAAGVLRPPWFQYEYADDAQTEFASTEDTTFTRNLFYLGVPLFVAWQSWAGHAKEKIVGRPRPYPPQAVPRAVKAAWERERALAGCRCVPAGGRPVPPELPEPAGGPVAEGVGNG